MAIVPSDDLRIRQRFIERPGCIAGCLDDLGGDVSLPWLYGGTGHVHQQVRRCSGPRGGSDHPGPANCPVAEHRSSSDGSYDE
jgi:hypothetical protein